MGGGPVDEEHEVPILGQPALSAVLPVVTPPEVSTVLPVEPPPPHSTFPEAPPASSTRIEINPADLEHPVLSSMAAGGVVGGIMGSMFGMGSVVGTTTGAFIAASVASRDDALGAKARNTALALKSNVQYGVSKAVDRINEEELGRDITQKVSAALQTIIDAGEKYKVIDKVETAATTVYNTAEPRVQALYGKLVEADKNEYIPKVRNAFLTVDQATGFTRSVEAVKRELKL